MKKYEHVDVIKALEAVMKSQIRCNYQSDFEIDKEVSAGGSQSTSPRRINGWFWMSRPSGITASRSRTSS